MDLKVCCLASALLGAGLAPAAAAQWFRVGGPELEAAVKATVEIDLESLHARSPGAEAAIRVSHGEPHTHLAGFAYRSFVATAQFDCQRRTVALSSAAYFSMPAGQGSRTGTDSLAAQGGMPAGVLDTVPSEALRALLRASCARMPAY